jgi:TolB-like protein/Tfp pilus assembly protein PilF
MYTDMVGYTALGQRNESLSLALVEEQRGLVRPILKRHNGREIKTMGDAFLVEFPSALDAVRCAYDIQRATMEFNLSMPAESRLHLRVGVHLGDVVEYQGDISGDAVNVASRIELLSEDGGVCLTRQVYDQVQNKFDLPLTNVGMKSLKNVTMPIEVFKIVMPWETETNGASRQLDKKRVAVLPFANMSPDPADEYFADGLTEELIDRLGQVRELEVIARTSVMSYKKMGKKAAEIAMELKAGSLVEGSVRKAGNKVRVTAQLINGATERHLWSSRYDKSLDDVFAVQSDIAEQVTDALRIQLLPKEKEAIKNRATESAEAHILCLKGRYYWNERTREGNARALKYFEEAIKQDPNYALAYAGLADCYVVAGSYGWLEPKEAFPKAKESATMAIEKNPGIAEAHVSLAAVFAEFEWKGEEAETEYKQAIELKPSYATAHQWYSMFLTMAGKLSDAYDEAKRARDFDPLSGAIIANLGERLLHMGKIDQALEEFKRLKETSPDFAWAYAWLGLTYLLSSKTGEAVIESRKAVSVSGGDPVAKAYLACVLGFVESRAEANMILEELNMLSENSPLLTGYVASILFALGRTDEAFDRLRRAFDERSITMDLWNFLGLPFFEKFRTDPRWTPLERLRGFR